MLFNSVGFALFLLVVFIFYWFVLNKDLKRQNLFLLAASYFFYACWDWRFLFLLAFSTLLDFFTGLKMSETEDRSKRKFWFWLSVSVNLGLLGVFKYYNFFAVSFAKSLALIGLHASPWTLALILPVGISFYTFHGLSYVIDIYKGRIKAETDIVSYSLFVGYFPLLVAGPIERATHLLPQIKRKRTFDAVLATDGLRQMIWGLFKKVVIADQCATIANNIFNNAGNYPGSSHLLGAVFFAIQIYCDFSGYSDIALGVSRIFGIELLRNFAYPYFSRDIAEFWRRWHISLSSWFRDYLYIPLGGSKVGKLKKIRNTVIIFLVSGFWHGANWTFIIWGLLNALYIMPSILSNTNRDHLSIVAQGKRSPTLKEVWLIGCTFGLTVLAWIFFRSGSVSGAIQFIRGIFSRSLFVLPPADQRPLGLCLLITLFFLVEWRGREGDHALSRMGTVWPRTFRWLSYYAMVFAICYFSGVKQEFIYFQF